MQLLETSCSLWYDGSEVMVVGLEVRKCKQCEETKLLTSGYWHKDKGCIGGFRPVCKDCRNGRSEVSKRKAKKGYKICTKCSNEKELTVYNWSKTKSTKDGFHTICKACRNKTDKIIIPINEDDGFRECSSCRIKKPLNIDYYKKDKQNYKNYNTMCRDCISKRDRLKRNTYRENHNICRVCLRDYRLSEKTFPKDRYCESGYSDICHNCNNINKKIENQILEKGNKFCTDCGEQFPEIRKYFFKRNDGYDCMCKKCRGYEFGIKQSVMNRKSIQGFKYCTQCKVLFPMATKHFHKSNSTGDGFTTSCKECLKTRTKKNIVQVRKSKRIAQQRRNSRKRNLPSTFTQEEWEYCKEHFNNRCCYCSNKTEGLQQDHLIPISKNGHYTNYNIVPSCQRCNVSKKDNNFEEWYSLQDFYSEERKNKILIYLANFK